ncbi:DNA-directed RNA polymerase [archaeon]|nr:DNA-directed RNA polymerase [archaeon]|tara:strand:- start:3341 stop:3937 length:597 start_codon:yes stop_codon:yes gene_type:complete
MFYEVELKSHIRVAPNLFGENIKQAVLTELSNQFNDFISKDFGIVIAVSDIVKIGEGIIIPDDGAAYYDTVFKLFVFKPEIQEVVLGAISDITDFGAFLHIGPIDGMIHISQTMDDFVSFSKTGVLSGKESKRILKNKDECRARIIAVSYKDVNDPKIGLTMRQGYLGNVKWIEDELDKKTKEAEKESKNEKKEKKKK